MPISELSSYTEGSVLVPEFLDDNQGILDQPPYEWLFDWLDERAPGLFKQDGIRGFVHLMRAVARVDKPEDADPTEALLGSRHISGTYSTKIRDIVTEVETYLHNFPHALEYLRSAWDDFDYWGNPKPRWTNEPPRRSYPAWAEAEERRQRAATMVGLEEEEPSGWSTEKDVFDALPPKPPTNRMFRLFHSGATE